jgi:hypothetical protein
MFQVFLRKKSLLNLLFLLPHLVVQKNQGTNFEFLYIERAEKIIEKFNQEIINERVSNLYDLYDLFEGKIKIFLFMK